MIKAKELLSEPHSLQRTSKNELGLIAWLVQVSLSKLHQCKSMSNIKTLIPHLGSTEKILIVYLKSISLRNHMGLFGKSTNLSAKMEFS